MKWIEVHLAKDFINSQIKRNKMEVEVGDYENYHRIGSIFWLNEIDPDILINLPYTQKFKKWTQKLKEAINK